MLEATDMLTGTLPAASWIRLEKISAMALDLHRSPSSSRSPHLREAEPVAD
jgi:hypothetical protein